MGQRPAVACGLRRVLPGLAGTCLKNRGECLRVTSEWPRIWLYIYIWMIRYIYIYNRIKICDLDEPWSSEKKSHSETYHSGMVPNTFSTKIGKGTSRPVARFFGMWTIYRLYRLRHNHMGEEPTRAWIPYGWNCWAPVACRTLFQAAKHVCNKCSTMQA